MELHETIELMNSSDYKKRFIAEYQQTKIRHDKLTEMLNKLEKGELNFTPTCPEELLREQSYIMAHYLGVLQIRAEYEGIDLYGIG